MPCCPAAGKVEACIIPHTLSSDYSQRRGDRGFNCRCCVSCVLQIVQAELSQLDAELPRLQATFADLGRQLQQASQELEALASQEGSGVYRPEAGPSSGDHIAFTAQ
jgi:hypothetical protein